MNHSANTSSVPSVMVKVFFASSLLALILSPVIYAGAQDSTQPKIKQRIIRVDRLDREESGKTKRVKTLQQTQKTAENNLATAIPCESILFLGDVESVRLLALNYQPNSTVTFT